jgi:hypothetical protein
MHNLRAVGNNEKANQILEVQSDCKMMIEPNFFT